MDATITIILKNVEEYDNFLDKTIPEMQDDLKAFILEETENHLDITEDSIEVEIE